VLILAWMAIYPLISWADDPMGTLQDSEPWLLELQAHRLLEKTRVTPGVILAPFTTDGCSGGLSFVWASLSGQFPKLAQAHGEKPPWEQCCLLHDITYHAGGDDPDSRKSATSRLQVDKELKACVIQSGEDRYQNLAETYGMTQSQIDYAYRIIAAAMFTAVRVGGAPCSGLNWRWGYGYPHCNWLD
jgi:hypothetical protein